MKELITDSERVGQWVSAQFAIPWVPYSGQGIGLAQDNTLIAGVIYEGWNGPGGSVRGHVAALPGSQWLNREFLHYCFWYPFEQLKVRKIIGLVAESNKEAQRFDESLGFRLKATLEDAHPDGALLIYEMTRADCRWLSLQRVENGEAERTTAA